MANKRTKVLGVGVAIVIMALLIVPYGNTYDYGLKCINCLRDRGIHEERWGDIKLYTSREMVRDEGHGAMYERAFGHPCDHVYQRGGFGRSPWFSDSIGCGSSADGIFYRMRMQLLEQAYYLADKLDDPAIVFSTMTLVDEWFPADLTNEQRENSFIPYNAADVILAQASDIQTAEQWKAALDMGRANVAAWRERAQQGDNVTEAIKDAYEDAPGINH